MRAASGGREKGYEGPLRHSRVAALRRHCQPAPAGPFRTAPASARPSAKAAMAPPIIMLTTSFMLAPCGGVWGVWGGGGGEGGLRGLFLM